MEDEIINLDSTCDVENIIFESTEYEISSKANLSTLGKFLNKHSTQSTDKMVTKNDAVKLPKLTIKKFDGDATKWQQFYNSFCVVERSTLSKVEKFNYLLGFSKEMLQNVSLGYLSRIRITIRRNNY